jgi:hypothetical protein
MVNARMENIMTGTNPQADSSIPAAASGSVPFSSAVSSASSCSSAWGIVTIRTASHHTYLLGLFLAALNGLGHEFHAKNTGFELLGRLVDLALEIENLLADLLCGVCQCESV